MNIESERANVIYWLQGEEYQNLGDFLSEYIFQEVLLSPRINAAAYRLLGSALVEPNIKRDVEDYCTPYLPKIAYWGCGMREDVAIPQDALDRCIIAGVRGPLTRQMLGLGEDTAIGDPGFILPLFHKPVVQESTSGKTICVPHFCETKSDEELLALSKADIVVRPRVENSIPALRRLIDEIISAKFVLAGSLHAAVIACAFDVPFAFWETGFVDIAFKWRDLAASINSTALFVANVHEGQRVYQDVMSPAIRKPKLVPILDCCPFHVRPSVLVQALRADGLVTDDVCQSVVNALERTRFESTDFAGDPGLSAKVATSDLFRSLTARIADLTQANSDLFGQNKRNEDVLAELGGYVSQLKSYARYLEAELTSVLSSSSWRLTAPYRKFGSLTKTAKHGMRRLFELLASDRKDKFRVIAAGIYRHVPMSHRQRVNLNARLKKMLPFLIRSTSPAAQPFPVETDGGDNWILMVEWRIPMPENNSGSAKMFQMAKIFLERGLRVFFISEHDLPSYHWVVSDRSELLPYEERLRKLGVEYVFGRDNAVAHLQQHGSRYRYAMLFYPDIAHAYIPLVRAYCPNARIIFDSGDLHFLRFEREAEVKKDPSLLEKADHYKKIETMVIDNSDVTVAISEEEKSIIQAMNPRARVEVQQNIYETQLNDSALPFEARRNLMFIGHYLHSPNVDAVKYFVEDIFPLIREEIPDVEFLVVGSNPTEEITRIKTPGVRIVGFVEDLTPLFNECRAFVVPLRYGAGVKGKVGQCMSYGLPLVTTSIGAEGMGLTNGVTALIDDDPREFAKATVRLYRDSQLWNDLRENSQRHIQDVMGYQRAKAQLGKILADLDDRGETG